MQQQTATMMTSLDHNLAGLDSGRAQQLATTTTQLTPIMKHELLELPASHQQPRHLQQQQQHHQNHFNPIHHQQQQQQQQQQHHHHQHQQHQQQHQLQQSNQQQQQPPQQNGPKPRGRRKKIRTEPIRPVCPQCEKQFSNQSALTKHKLTHSDERKFACQQCSKAFKRHDHLTGHMQTHSNRKPFNCTIQGCDKTYCDARSLRRHKENIHHIVTQTQEPSHLLRRRIQRLHSDQGVYNRTVEHHQLNCVTAPPHSLPPQTSLTPQPVTTTTPTPNGNSNSSSSSSSGGSIMSNHHHHQSYLNHHHHHHHHHGHHANQHGSFSADYASTQHFSFDFVPGSGGAIGNSAGGSGDSGFISQHHPVPQHQQHHPHHHQGDANHLEHHVTGLDQGLGARSTPHSAESITDSGLGLNVLKEQHTPQPLSLPPPPARLYHAQDHQQHQQHHQQQQQQLQDHVSYSAGYATTQHFDFDFVTSTSNNNHQQATGFANQHGSFSADYASTQHFSFDSVPGSSGGGDSSFMSNHHPVSHHHQHHPHHHQGDANHLEHHVTSLDQGLGARSTPHSAESITDSGLGLNVLKEQHTPQPLSLPPPPARLYHAQDHQQHQHHHHQPQHHHHHNHHQQQQLQPHVSYSAGYATTQHFDFDFVTSTSTNNHHQATALDDRTT